MHPMKGRQKKIPISNIFGIVKFPDTLNLSLWIINVELFELTFSPPYFRLCTGFSVKPHRFPGQVQRLVKFQLDHLILCPAFSFASLIQPLSLVQL